MAAATRARRFNPQAEIIVVEATGEFSRGTCSLPYLLSGEIEHAEQLQVTTLSALESERIELRLHTTASCLHPSQRKLETSGSTLFYDRLIVSTGSKPKDSQVFPCSEHPRLWRLRTIRDVQEIRQQLNDRSLRRVAVIGGGYVGIEFAESLCTLGLEVTIFQRQATLMRLSPEISDSVCRCLQQNGIRVLLESEVSKADPETGLLHYRCGGQNLSDTFHAFADCGGIEPEPSLLALAGARLGPSGAVLVDSRGETSLSNVYACGDAVEIPHPKGGRARWIPLATTAARLGRVCGENAAGGSRRLGANYGALSLRVFERQLGTLGQPQDWENCSSLRFQWGSESSSFPRRRAGQGLLFFERSSERLRGLQAFGCEAGQLVDILSLSVDKNLTLADLQEQDFAYNPPLSGLWHPLYLASRKAEKSLQTPTGRYS